MGARNGDDSFINGLIAPETTISEDGRHPTFDAKELRKQLKDYGRDAVKSQLHLRRHGNFVQLTTVFALPRILPLSVLLAAVLFQTAHAEGETNVRLQWVKSSETDLATVMLGDFDGSPESNYAVGGSWGKQYSDTLFGAPIAMTANVGVQWFNERGYQADGWGGTAYIKALYDWRLPWTGKHVRLGLGEGLSYVTQIPESEKRDFAKKGVDSVNLMNYLEWTIDVPLRQFAPLDSVLRGKVDEVYLGFVVWHRSTVFGLFGEASGGVNFMGFGFEVEY